MADDTNPDNVTMSTATRPRKVRELPPLSPSKRPKSTKSAKNRKPKLDFDGNNSEKHKSFERSDSTKKLANTEPDVGAQKPSPAKIKPALPPRSPRKLPVISSKEPEASTDVKPGDAVPAKPGEEKKRTGSASTLRGGSVSSDDSTRRTRPKKLSKDNSNVSGSQQRLVSSQSEDTLEFDLTELEDDITELDNNTAPVISVNLVESIPSQSQHISKCFVEKKDAFKMVDKKAWMDAVQLKNSNKETMNNEPVESALQLAQFSHKVFKTFALFCHGLLAGISLWQIIVVYQLSDPQRTTDDFLNHYTYISQPLQSLFAFLLAICVVSVFDKYEFGRLNLRLLKDIFTLRKGAFAVVIYLITFILNLCIINMDDKLSLHQHNSTWWTDSESTHDIEENIGNWKTANLCRCIGAIIGWMMISFYPYVDNLSQNLMELKSFKDSNERKVATIT